MNVRITPAAAVAFACGLIFATLGSDPAGVTLVPASAAVPVIVEPLVKTVAGDGSYANRDGSAASASFMEPAGIAVRDGSAIYVADASANAVRVLQDGQLRTIAGSPATASGFADGPASTARFARPVGIAIGRDGALYVADSLNHRIRRVKNGVVQTFAGGSAVGKADGRSGSASFNLPKGVAIDNDDNLYVADYGTGIRKIAPDGNVSTMAFPNNGAIYGIAARGSGAGLILAYTDSDGIHIVTGGKHRGLAFGTEREPYSEDNHVGTAFGVAIVDANSVVVTDLATNAVRYVNFNDPPFRPAPKARTLAGGTRDGALERGGFRDGATGAALMRAPYGVAISTDGRIFVADSGNRRIREIDGLNSRLPIASNLDNLTFPSKTYRIALIGDSFTWNNILWPESIGGALETGLTSAARAAGLPMDPTVLALSASGGTLGSATEFILNNVGDGQADLVVLVYDKLALSHEFEAVPSLAANDKWKSVLPGRIVTLAQTLQKNGTKFALLMIPIGRDVSPVEQAAQREDGRSPQSYDFAANYASGLAFEDVFARTPVHVVRTLTALAGADREPDAPLLYNVRDAHLTIPGNAALAKLLLADLVAWKPWAATPHR